MTKDNDKKQKEKPNQRKVSVGGPKIDILPFFLIPVYRLRFETKQYMRSSNWMMRAK